MFASNHTPAAEPLRPCVLVGAGTRAAREWSMRAATSRTTCSPRVGAGSGCCSVCDAPECHPCTNCGAAFNAALQHVAAAVQAGLRLAAAGRQEWRHDVAAMHATGPTCSDIVSLSFSSAPTSPRLLHLRDQPQDWHHPGRHSRGLPVCFLLLLHLVVPHRAVS